MKNPWHPRKICYSSGYKYVLRYSYEYQTEIATTKLSPETPAYPYVLLFPGGKLMIRAGYAWDGPSGIAIDTKSFMRGSLLHDALYQLIREGHLQPSFRLYADELLRKVCLEDGMNPIRAWWVYQCVRMFGAKYAKTARESYEVAP